MRGVIAVLIGAVIAVGAAMVLVHNGTMTGQGPARVLFSYGYGYGSGSG
jgi:hypothetical protein